MRNTRPLLVVTPTLGQSPWLDRTVLSVEIYAGAVATHVLVAPPKALGALGARFPHCTLVADTVARGVYPAINLGLARAPDPAWKWFTWLNDDDEFLPGFAWHVERTLRHDGSGLDAPWAYGKVQLSNSEDDNLGHVAVARSPSDIVTLAKAGVSPLNQQGMLAPRAWVDKGGPFREDLMICADVDFWLKAVTGGARFRYSSETVALFRLHAGQISADVKRHRAEFRQAVQALTGVPARGLARWAARARFRLGNACVYADRVQRCGWKGGFAMLEKPVRRPL
jgi:hypothetical protein